MPTGRQASAVPVRSEDVQLGIVEVHAVGDQHVAAEDAEVVEVLDRAATRAGEVRRGIGVGRRQVKGQCRAGVGRPARLAATTSSSDIRS